MAGGAEIEMTVLWSETRGEVRVIAEELPPPRRTTARVAAATATHHDDDERDEPDLAVPLPA